MTTATADHTLAGFLRDLSAGTAAPGGGAAAAVCAAMAGALVTMVANLTLGREKYTEAQAEMQIIAQAGPNAIEACLQLADADQQAFSSVMRAYALPKASETEKISRAGAIQDGLRQATEVPLETMRQALAVQRAALATVVRGNRSAHSDAICAGLLAGAAFAAAMQNVRVNLPGIRDAGFATDARRIVDELDAAQKVLADAFAGLSANRG